jgi:hypothetical protein
MDIQSDSKRWADNFRLIILGTNLLSSPAIIIGHKGYAEALSAI